MSLEFDQDRSAIRQRMQQIRLGLPTTFGIAKAEVRELTSWRFYLRKFPAILLPAVALTSFLLVPEKPATPLKQTNRLVGKLLGSTQADNEVVAKRSFMAGVASAAAGIALRSITAYASRRFAGVIQELASNKRQSI